MVLNHVGKRLDHMLYCWKNKMMWAGLGLLVTALTVESYIVHDQHERLYHGRQLKIYLPKSSEKLEFTSADNTQPTLVYWDKMRSSSRALRGHVSGSGNDRRWYLEQVTFDDEGTYVQKDYWGKEISSLKVAVLAEKKAVQRVAGRTLYISLEGIRKEDATLRFYGQSDNVTLVRHGSPVSQELADYYDRVRLSSKNIEIVKVNISDVGLYSLSDRKDRLVSTTKLELTDVEVNGHPLLALLLLLGIPAGICCCCRKKIFKSKATTAQTQASPGTVVVPSGPTGPCPPYNQPQPGGGYYPAPSTDLGPSIHPPPAAPGPGQWNGPPTSPGFNPAPNPTYPPQNPGYPPQNPGYPPQNPGYPPQNPGYPPAGAPQWNGPPPAAGPYPSYSPAPNAPMGYTPAPVMYSEPPAKEEIKMENMAPAPTDPLLAQPPQTSPSSGSAPPVPPSTIDALHSTDTAATFDISKNSTNFL